ncbi:hypothetical protein ASwh1_263 [Aeromonas phage Aswh_1]|nr:hypothetical protein ASwh1_263 [Aeromonas phage Aswh_1]
MSKFVIHPIDHTATKILVDSKRVVGLIEKSGITVITVEDKWGNDFIFNISDNFDYIAGKIIHD